MSKASSPKGAPAAPEQAKLVEGEAAEGEAAEGEPDEEQPRAPWHFKVLLVGTALYLVYRLIWFIFWLAGHAWHG